MDFNKLFNNSDSKFYLKNKSVGQDFWKSNLFVELKEILFVYTQNKLYAFNFLYD